MNAATQTPVAQTQVQSRPEERDTKMVTIANLWEKQGRGQSYMVGNLHGLRLFVFFNSHKKGPKDPEYILKAEVKKDAVDPVMIEIRPEGVGVIGKTARAFPRPTGQVNLQSAEEQQPTPSEAYDPNIPF